MALTTLDPNTALIIVDLQKGIVGLPLIHPIDGVIERARALADAFRERGLPVVCKRRRKNPSLKRPGCPAAPG